MGRYLILESGAGGGGGKFIHFCISLILEAAASANWLTPVCKDVYSMRNWVQKWVGRHLGVRGWGEAWLVQYSTVQYYTDTGDGVK